VVLSASVAFAVSNRTVVTGSTLDKFKLVRGSSATVSYPINQPNQTAWVNVADMSVVMNVPAGTTRLLVVNLHTEDVPHGDFGNYTVLYRMAVDGQPTRTDTLPEDRPVLATFDAVGPLGPGNHTIQMQVAVPDFFCTTPDSCSGQPPPIGPPPLTVTFAKPWEIGVQRIVIP
jgi:predicted membrane-bound mannosyltransferase